MNSQRWLNVCEQSSLGRPCPPPLDRDSSRRALVSEQGYKFRVVQTFAADTKFSQALPKWCFEDVARYKKRMLSTLFWLASDPQTGGDDDDRSSVSHP